MIFSLSLLMVHLMLFGATFCKTEKTIIKTSLKERFDPKIQSYAFVIPNLGPVKGIGGIKARDCARCHKKIYEEWSGSTHSMALRDIQFQAELTKAGAPKWICLNCHIPVQNQREYIITHLEDGNIMKPIKKINPQFDPLMQKEAVSCASCHIRSDKEGKSYIIGSSGSSLAPHSVKKDRPFLINLCLRCHNPKGERLTENLLCWFHVQKELDQGQKNLVRTLGAEKTCVDCHMPEARRRLVSASKNLPKRKGRKHHWVGGGIPKLYQGYEHLIERGYKSALGVEIKEISHIKTDKKIRVKIVLKNAGAGHWLPTADPERFILMIASLEDNSGKVLYKEKLRIGQIWKWNPARKIADNRLKQGEKRNWIVDLSAPDSLNGIKLIVTGIHVRLSSENMRYSMNAKGVNESYLKNGQYLVANAKDFYPMASYVFKEEIDLNKKTRKKYSLKELILFSIQEKKKKLSEREY